MFAGNINISCRTSTWRSVSSAEKPSLYVGNPLKSSIIYHNTASKRPGALFSAKTGGLWSKSPPCQNKDEKNTPATQQTASLSIIAPLVAYFPFTTALEFLGKNDLDLVYDGSCGDSERSTLLYFLLPFPLATKESLEKNGLVLVALDRASLLHILLYTWFAFTMSA